MATTNFQGISVLTDLQIEAIAQKGAEYALMAYSIPKSTDQISEIVDTPELGKRLNLSEPTIVRWREKGKIPYLRIGTNIRYDWAKVLEAIEANQKKK